MARGLSNHKGLSNHSTRNGPRFYALLCSTVLCSAVLCCVPCCVPLHCTWTLLLNSFPKASGLSLGTAPTASISVLPTSLSASRRPSCNQEQVSTGVMTLLRVIVTLLALSPSVSSPPCTAILNLHPTTRTYIVQHDSSTCITLSSCYIMIASSVLCHGSKIGSSGTVVLYCTVLTTTSSTGGQGSVYQPLEPQDSVLCGLQVVGKLLGNGLRQAGNCTGRKVQGEIVTNSKEQQLFPTLSTPLYHSLFRTHSHTSPPYNTPFHRLYPCLSHSIPLSTTLVPTLPTTLNSTLTSELLGLQHPEIQRDLRKHFPELFVRKRQLRGPVRLQTAVPRRTPCPHSGALHWGPHCGRRRE